MATFLFNIISGDARIAESIAKERVFRQYHFTSGGVHLARLVRLIFPDVHSLVDNAWNNIQLNHRRTLNQLDDCLHEIANAIIVHGADVGLQAIFIQHLVFTQKLWLAITRSELCAVGFDNHLPEDSRGKPLVVEERVVDSEGSGIVGVEAAYSAERLSSFNRLMRVCEDGTPLSILTGADLDQLVCDFPLLRVK